VRTRVYPGVRKLGEREGMIDLYTALRSHGAHCRREVICMGDMPARTTHTRDKVVIMTVNRLSLSAVRVYGILLALWGNAIALIALAYI